MLVNPRDLEWVYLPRTTATTDRHGDVLLPVPPEIGTVYDATAHAHGMGGRFNAEPYAIRETGIVVRISSDVRANGDFYPIPHATVRAALAVLVLKVEHQ